MAHLFSEASVNELSLVSAREKIDIYESLARLEAGDGHFARMRREELEEREIEMMAARELKMGRTPNAYWTLSGRLSYSHASERKKRILDARRYRDVPYRKLAWERILEQERVCDQHVTTVLMGNTSALTRYHDTSRDIDSGFDTLYLAIRDTVSGIAQC